mgnify:CR=1 FL=1
MEVIDFSKSNSILNKFMSEMRDANIQCDQMRFRRNMERTGEIMAYEISKRLEYETVSVQTPLGTATTNVPCEDVVLATVFRAGLPFHQGFHNYFDHCQNGFVSAHRDYTGETSFDVKIEYLASPCIDGKTLILVDPMLATGTSMYLTYQALLTKGTPKAIHIASVIASVQGVEYMKDKLAGTDCTIWCAAIDDKLNEHSYIVPGLGDAGDLSFGEK